MDVVHSNGHKEIKALTSKECIEDEIIKNEEKHKLYYEINKLSHNEKELIRWFYFENKTLEEYAKEKGICYSSAVKRKCNAIKRLRYQMD
jgi:DNA-directed RNA polymerase specialized sigma subunit